VEQHVPLLFSGAGIRAGSRLGTCELIDIAPTLALLLGGDMPQQSEGRALWEILDTASDPPVGAYQELIRERDRCLNNLKQLRKQFAVKAIEKGEFAKRKAELSEAVGKNRVALLDASRNLRKDKISD
jgi:arylsulfatase A-like enzyme